MVVRKSAVITGALLAIPAAFALSTGISPLDSTFNLLGRLFNITAFQNEQTALGVARLAWFILIFSILYWSGQKVFKGDNAHTNKNVATIVSLVLAFISAFFIPTNILLTATSGYAIILWTLILMLPAILCALFAFGTFYKDKDKQHTFGSRMLELLALVLGVAWLSMMTGTLLLWVREQFPNIATSMDNIMAVAITIFTLAAIGKLIQAFTAIKGDASGGGFFSNLFNGKGDGDKAAKNKRIQRPGPLQNVTHAYDEKNDRTIITWDHRPAEESVERYELQRRVAKFQGWNPNIFGGWETIGHTQENAAVDTGSRTRALLNPRNLTYGQNRKVHSSKMYEYRVRARNAGGKGPWTESILTPNQKTPEVTPIPKKEEKANIEGAAAKNAEASDSSASSQKTSLDAEDSSATPLSSDASQRKAALGREGFNIILRQANNDTSAKEFHVSISGQTSSGHFSRKEGVIHAMNSETPEVLHFTFIPEVAEYNVEVAEYAILGSSKIVLTKEDQGTIRHLERSFVGSQKINVVGIHSVLIDLIVSPTFQANSATVSQDVPNASSQASQSDVLQNLPVRALFVKIDPNSNCSDDVEMHCEVLGLDMSLLQKPQMKKLGKGDTAQFNFVEGARFYQIRIPNVTYDITFARRVLYNGSETKEWGKIRGDVLWIDAAQTFHVSLTLKVSSKTPQAAKSPSQITHQKPSSQDKGLVRTEAQIMSELGKDALILSKDKDASIEWDLAELQKHRKTLHELQSKLPGGFWRGSDFEKFKDTKNGMIIRYFIGKEPESFKQAILAKYPETTFGDVALAIGEYKELIEQDSKRRALVEQKGTWPVDELSDFHQRLMVARRLFNSREDTRNIPHELMDKEFVEDAAYLIIEALDDDNFDSKRFQDKLTGPNGLGFSYDMVQKTMKTYLERLADIAAYKGLQ